MIDCSDRKMVVIVTIVSTVITVMIRNNNKKMFVVIVSRSFQTSGDSLGGRQSKDSSRMGLTY